jgi:uncharacterized membrane protein YvlD (DUF360 family)
LAANKCLLHGNSQLKLPTFLTPLLTFGLFVSVISALMRKPAAALVPGFRVKTFGSALFGTFLLIPVNAGLRFAVFTTWDG